MCIRPVVSSFGVNVPSRYLEWMERLCERSLTYSSIGTNISSRFYCLILLTNPYLMGVDVVLLMATYNDGVMVSRGSQFALHKHSNHRLRLY